MPTCPRCALVAFALAVAAFAAGCDSTDPGSDLEAVDGTYEIVELRFDPATAGLPEADVLARLADGSAEVEIAGDGTSLVRYAFIGQTRQLVLADASATSRSVTIAARSDADADKLDAILLPETVTFARAENDATRLSATLLLEGVDLEAFDPAIYQDQIDNRGTMTVALRLVR